ncbi:MAG: hypothetical protein RTU92_04205, partial [Candidatus Thorarchaeota archaeon]
MNKSVRYILIVAFLGILISPMFVDAYTETSTEIDDYSFDTGQSSTSNILSKLNDWDDDYNDATPTVVECDETGNPSSSQTYAQYFTNWNKPYYSDWTRGEWAAVIDGYGYGWYATPALDAVRVDGNDY